MTSIALNARFYAHRPTGMQRYALELSRRFAEHLDPLMPSKPLRGPSGHLWEQFYLPSAVHGRLLWSPNNTGPLAVAKQVCTIHDLIPLDHPEWFNHHFARWYAWLLPRLAKRVRLIVAISEFTKRRAIELLGITPDKIVVIPNGVDTRFSPRPMEEIAAARCELGIPSPSYLLYVGSLEPRKNLLRLLDAWARVQTRVPEDVILVVAGAAGSSRVFRSVAMESSPRVRFTGYVADEWLPALYSGAMALIYPSLYEGFGLPPLEAMACGSPVVTSNTTSLPEVVGDGALLVDPNDVNSIADGVVSILENNGVREELRRRGLARAAQFTWERTARETLNLLLQQA